MELTEKQVSSELKYKGVIVDVYLDRAELCDGKIARREVVKHPGGVTVLPVDSDGMCYMVRQYRYPAGKTLLETPAGKLEYGEEHLSCAVRELSEETGFSTEIIHVYLARGLHAGKSHPDEGEFLNVEKYSFDTLTQMVADGEIEDAKTVIAILKAAKYLK